ncbi:probable tubulin polyglutamylase TTLL2, partial [Osmerus eperlanus]|uniref:probable tubulin polyglutamylase TTLL2 n=1 Tax=Osmerus eperlanus TaxID=29151 RepID=UPI002E0D6E06
MTTVTSCLVDLPTRAFRPMSEGVRDTPPLVFRLHDGAPELVREVLLERGWEEFNSQEHQEGDWNLYWRPSAFHASDYKRLLPWQRLNHHPKTVGITRKDCLARNLRRMRGTFGSTLYDFSPTVFILPNDYTRFLAEYTKHHLCGEGRGGGGGGGGEGGRATGYWICKPVDLSRGRGIYIFEDVKDLVYNSSVIVQRYVSDPLLISGYKFDLRLYVCVKSFQPLTVYMHQEGLVRFATEKYSLSSLENLFSHLTNTSINKFGPSYTTDKERVGQGCKWTMSKFRCFLHSQGVDQQLLWLRINSIVTLTLLTVAPSIPPSRNCVELLGFDILIDAALKPWLLEVNFSPALSTDCQADVTVKKGLVHDMIDLMGYQSEDSLRQRGYLRQKHKRPCYLGSQSQPAPGLPLPKSVCRHQSKKRSHSQSSLQALLTEQRRKFPPSSQLNQTGSSLHWVSGTAGPHPILPPHPHSIAEVTGNRRTRPTPSSLVTGNRATAGVSEVTDVSGDTDASTPDSLRRRATPQHHHAAGFSSSSSSSQACKLPAIPPRRQLSVRSPWANQRQERIMAPRPPCRVGDFILTFPFNRATLRASRDGLDVRTAVQEVSKLAAQLTSRRSQAERSKRRKEEE